MLQPTVLVFEDVRWADEPTLDLLRFLAHRVGPLRALVVASYRDDEIGLRHPLRLLLGDLETSRIVRRLTLTLLSLDAVRALASGSNIDAAALHRQTAGNPFFVVEALAGGDDGIPAAVRDAVLTRAARLSEPARDAREAAAVLGFRAEATLLTGLLGACSRAPDECVRAGLLRAELDAFSFRHELARQAVLDAMAPHRRAELHRRVLETLRSTSDDPDGLARLAHHAELTTGAGSGTKPPFVVPGSGKVVKQTGPSTSADVATGLTAPTALAFGPDGGLYVGGPGIGAYHGEGVILRLDPAATTAVDMTATPSASCSSGAQAADPPALQHRLSTRR